MTKYINEQTGESLTQEEYDSKMRYFDNLISQANEAEEIAQDVAEKADIDLSNKIRARREAYDNAQRFESSHYIQD